MDRNEEQSFSNPQTEAPNEQETHELTQETEAQQSAPTESPEKTPFQRMIEGEGRQEFEQMVGQRIQAAIQQRFKNQQDWKKQAEESEALVKALAEKYGVDEQTLRERAKAPVMDQAGGPNDPDQALKTHFFALTREAEALKREFPGFDLMCELRNPAFVRMTAPGSGMTVKAAFYALHGEAIRRMSMRDGAWHAGQMIAESIRAGASRPPENGMEKPAAASVGLDIQNMDRQSREMYRRRIRNGEVIDFVRNI